MGIRAAAGLIVATLCAPVIGVADDSVTLADLSRGDQVWVRLTSGGEPVRGTIDATGPGEIVVRPRDPAQKALRLSPQQVAASGPISLSASERTWGQARSEAAAPRLPIAMSANPSRIQKRSLPRFSRMNAVPTVVASGIPSALRHRT